jgi:hypothetical protein
VQFRAGGEKMKAVRPRALKFRGTVDAAGFVFDTRLPGLAEARRRVLAAWTQGAQVFQLDEALLLRLPSSHSITCDTAMGAPLVKSNEVLFAAPLEPDEQKAIAAPRNSVVLVKGGEIVVVELFDSISEHPADWLDIDTFNIVKTASLGAPPAAPRVVEAKPDFNARQKLDGVPAEAPELAEILAALRSPNQQADKPAAQQGATTTGWQEDAARIITSFFAGAAKASGAISGLAAKFRGALARLVGNSSASQGNSGKAPSISPQQPVNREPSFAEKLSAKMRQWAARVLVATKLSHIVGQKQAQYIARMMDMFERGDIQEALRHAIPIDGLASGLSKPALSVPTARDNLSLSPYQTRAGSSIYMGDDLLGELRRLYRQSFERLEAQGRIEEAAFVLAELLQANEEAVAFLERHGKLRLAAEMAEARELAPGLVIRQWFIAGDKERALLLARRTNAFAEALVWLERKDKKQAEIWRLLWSAALADAGNYTSAVDVIWSVTSGRNLAADWMNKAIEVGGTTGARMLARKLSLLPQTFDEVKEQALALLEDESTEQAAARLSFADTLRSGERTPQTKTLARAAVRAVLRDVAHASETITSQQYHQLIDFAADSALRADAPALPAVSRMSLLSRDSVLQLHIAASDVGTMAIQDVALLPDGRTVVALGEAGVKLLTRDGRTVAHFDQPANKLVLSDNGDRAIAMAKRGEVWRLARLDFLARRAEYWIEARVDAFANDYDGSMWFIGAGEDFYAIDATAKRFDAIWRVPDVESRVLAVARSASSCRFITSFGCEEWHYELPSLRLRGRNPIKLRSNETDETDETYIAYSNQIALSADGVLADHSLYLVLEKSGTQVNSLNSKQVVDTNMTLKRISMPFTLFINGVFLREIKISSEEEQKPVEEYNPVIPSIFGNWAAASVIDKTEARVLLIDVKEGKVRAEIALEKASDIVVRVQKDVLTVGDNRGRLLVMEINSGHLIRNLRI